MAYTPTLITTTSPADSLKGAGDKCNTNFEDIQDELDTLASATTSFDFSKSGLIGGTGTDLDGIDGDDLSGGETAVVIVGDNPGMTYFYVCDADNGGSESVPYLITPDLNPGTKRWVLSARVKRLWAGGASPTVNDDEDIGVATGDMWLYSGDIWVCVDPTDGAAVWLKWLKLGSGTGTACEGNDTRIPSQGENDALVGTSGTPSSTNKYVTNADSRNSDARTPTAHGSAAHTGTIGTESQVTFASSGGHSHDGSGSTVADHANLLNKGSNSHDTIDTHLGASAPHSGHEVTSAKGASNGYCPLDSGGLVAAADLGTGTPSSSTILYGDQTWGEAPTGSGSGSYAFTMMMMR